MADNGVDKSRRTLLTIGASTIGAVGTVTTLWPFVSTMAPSARALAAGAPVEVDLSKLQPGEKIEVEWRRKPVWIVRRSAQMVDSLKKTESRLRDPASIDPQQPAFAQNEIRALKPEFLVLVGICTHLGCSPTFRPEIAPEDLGPNWVGGFYCPCHGSRFDLSGRVYQNVPANKNLEVPPYKFISENVVLIGETDTEEAA